VAYIVATYQVQKNLELRNQDQLRKTCERLKIIQYEMTTNQSKIESLIPYSPEEHKELVKWISDDVWRSSICEIKVSDKLLRQLNISYSKLGVLQYLPSSTIDDDLLQTLVLELKKAISMITAEHVSMDKELEKPT
jgi:hypothetical protein